MSEINPILSREQVIEDAQEGNLRFYFKKNPDVWFDFVFCETDSDSEEKWVYMKSKRVGRAMREWVECDLDNMSWPSIETGLNAKIFDGQSLLEVLDKVTFI